MIRHSETAKMSRTSSFLIQGGQLSSSGGRTLFSDSLKLQLYQHRGQLNLLKVEVYLKPPHLNIALWGFFRTESFITLCLVREWPLFASLALMFDLTLGAFPSGLTTSSLVSSSSNSTSSSKWLKASMILSVVVVVVVVDDKVELKLIYCNQNMHLLFQ